MRWRSDPRSHLAGSTSRQGSQLRSSPTRPGHGPRGPSLRSSRAGGALAGFDSASAAIEPEGALAGFDSAPASIEPEGAMAGFAASLALAEVACNGLAVDPQFARDPTLGQTLAVQRTG